MRQSLEEFFSNIWHRWVKQPKTCVKANIESVECGILGLFIRTFDDWLNSFNVVISQIFKPKFVEILSHLIKFKVVKAFIDFCNRLAQFGDDPLITQGKF